MSKIHTIPATAADPTVAAGTAQFLTPVVLGLQALVVNGKQAHWNVRGTNFLPIHELLDSVVTHAQDWSDTAAERIVALGLPIDARLATISAKVKDTAVPAGFAQWDEVVSDVISDIDAVLVDIRAAVEGLGEVDASSQDVAIEIQRGIEKDRWFLVAHLSS
ncbi:Fine tangled pili major subunit [Microbacterium lemovicicum]|uniref:Fine tangled pili major subunit n=1 Tax=Microbacterium lemovicicum TaxID=1072463 RepID=A0A3Q9IY75_9MICO|nr:DNA starvation/stationary phase protection protein [Microbacterium lemovicicum]AZS36955.1 Fine tangled pili major subunit [Microbacterium lemovicicum]